MQTIELARRERIDFLLAIGGGSEMNNGAMNWR
jgi:alcohol dehydrogenase YqhD (iron-dependent ADH family)